MKRALSILLAATAAALVSRPCRADNATPVSAPAVVEALPVTFEAQKTTLTAERVRLALEQELGVRVGSVERLGGAGLAISVQQRRARVSFTDERGGVITRNVELSGDDARSAEIIALLAGNLARDQASELLSRLTPIEPEPVKEVEPAPAPEPGPEPEPEKPDSPGPAAAPPPAVPAVPAKKAETRPPAPEEAAIVNLSLYHPITLHPHSERRRFHFEFGAAYSRVGAIEGLGITLGYLRVQQQLEGAAITLGLTRVDGDVDGFQASALMTEGHGRLRGYEAASALALRWGDVEGAQTAALATLARDVRGAQGAAGLAMARDVQGFQGAAGLSLARDVEGLQAAAGLALARDVKGVQASVITIERDLHGAQLGMVSISRDVNGLQAGVVNVARKVDLQLGLVNVADHVDEAAWGLVTIAGNGKVQPAVWSTLDSAIAVNGGVRFVAGYGFSQLGVGVYPDGRSLRTEAGAGVHLELGEVWFVEGSAHVSERYLGTMTMGEVEQHRLHYRAGAGVDLGPVAFWASYDVNHDVVDFGADLRPASPVVGVALF